MPHYVDLDDEDDSSSSTEEDDSSASRLIRDVQDSDEDAIDSNYALFLSEMGPALPEPEPEPEPVKKKRRKDEEERAPFEAGESSQPSQWNPNEVDGLVCPICLEAWTNDGDHYICCLPCGHIFGMSCIKRWISQPRKQKCPHCNAKCKMKDVRKLFASRVIAVDEESQKRIRSLEGKCAALEMEREKWHKKEAELLEAQIVLERKLQQLLESTASGYTTGTAERRFQPGNNTTSARSYGETFGSNLCGRTSSCDFRLEAELCVIGARVFDIDASNQILLIARRNAGICGKDVLTKMSMIPPYDTDDIVLPGLINSIRDLRICPFNTNLALYACLRKKLVVLSTESNNIIVSYDLPAAAWTCSWDLNDSNFIYAGLQNGYLLMFDMRQTSGPVGCLKGLTSNPIHTVQSLSSNSALPPSVRTVISASSIGLCLWNFGGAEDQGPVLVPETENQGVCISLAYCPKTDEMVASYRPKVEFSDETAFTQPVLSPSLASRAMGQGTVGSHVILKRAGSSNQFLKLGSSVATVCDIGLPKSAIINTGNRGRFFASEDKLSSRLVLKGLSSFSTVQRLSLRQSPVHDVKYTSSSKKGFLGCLNGDTLQLFSTEL